MKNNGTHDALSFGIQVGKAPICSAIMEIIPIPFAKSIYSNLCLDTLIYLTLKFGNIWMITVLLCNPRLIIL